METNTYPRSSIETKACVSCQSSTIESGGYRERRHRDIGGIRIEKVLRLRCSNCKRSVGCVYPEGVLRYKWYSIKVQGLFAILSVASLRDDGEAFSFDDALTTLIQRMRHSELDISVSKRGDGSDYSKLTLMTLYRVIQEGLTNVHKYAGATKVNIKLDFSEKNAFLELSDNGRGFTREWQDSEQATFGLKGLQERLSLVGGQLFVSSQVQGSSNQEQGTKLWVNIPKKILPSSADYG
jgi:Histidine kinase-, DNA gyrase B-, and HSP90-like ATPase